jgi:arylsulfatase A-like enzyme
VNPLERLPRLNNAWVNAKHRLSHWRDRRGRDLAREFDVPTPRNVLVVVIDCLRADHVSGFGHDRPTTPTLDAFDAAAFSRATAAAPWTFPSVPSLLSGRYPRNHGGRFDADPRDLSSEQFPRRPDPSVPMLPDLLAGAGYDTGLVTAIPMAEKAAGDRFAHVDVRYTDAAERVATAREWLAGRDRWCLHLHLGDPHAPLDVPDGHRATFDVPDVDGLADWSYRESTDADGFDAYRDARTRAYDAAIRGADDALADLLATVDDETVVVVCGDHGEAFWEHPDLERRLNDDPRGYYATDHGHSTFEEVATVPLWLRAPGVADLDARATDARVSLADVLPTVLAALDADVPPGVDGVALPADADPDRPIVCEETAYGYDQVATYLGDRKLISVPETGAEVAFDLTADPGETTPLERVPADLREAAAAVGGGDVAGGDRMAVDDEARDRLSELGYLE